MKKSLLVICMTFMSLGCLWSQCVFSCYSYSVTPITYSVFPNAGFDAISQFLPTIDDGATPLIPLGFNFSFYCNTYSNVLVTSNGFLQFDIGSPPNLAFANPAQAFPDPTSPNGMVAFNMNDLDANMGGIITYTTVGVNPNQRFILTYSNVPMWSCSTVVNTGQIILYQTSNIIEIHTGSVMNPLNNAILPCYAGTQGIEDASGTMGTTISGRSASTWTATTSDAYRFVPIPTYTPAAPTSTITGPLSLCEGLPASFTVNTNPAASQYNWSLPFGWTGTSTISTISTTVSASGLVYVTSTYSCGTSAPTMFSVTVVPSPVISITSATPNILCSGITVTFNATGALTYTMDPPGLVGTPPFTDMPMTSTTYSISGTNTAGCISPNPAMYFITVKETPTIAVNSGSICLGQGFTMTPTGVPPNNFVYQSIFPYVTPTVAGVQSYSVTGTATNGCVGNTVISTVTVAALPNITAVPTKTAICKQEKTTLTAGGASTFTWSTGASTAVITVSPSTTTSYTVTGTDANGCVNSQTVSLKINSCVGIEHYINETGQVNIYPNPNNGFFTVHVNSITEGSVLEVYNSVGQLIISQKINSENTDVNLKNQANGLYYLKLKDGDHQKVLRVIKE